MPDSPPALEGRYRIDETRVGGQSIVYKAVEVQLERTVAIRTPNEATRRDPSSTELCSKRRSSSSRCRSQRPTRRG